jgi:hypothetical protein
MRLECNTGRQQCHRAAGADMNSERTIRQVTAALLRLCVGCVRSRIKRAATT